MPHGFSDSPWIMLAEEYMKNEGLLFGEVWIWMSETDLAPRLKESHMVGRRGSGLLASLGQLSFPDPSKSLLFNT